MSKRPPGLLRATENPDVLMMICTAGHVDHGKTRLVRLLTGCNTDRLKEEQDRGLTIELGFAPCTLGGNLCVGIVDVPGHEKFVKNMVAGVSGIDLAILVIAADDGIMPQTVEHFQIMTLLGVRNGIVALTKTDLVTPERVDEVRAAIRRFLAGSFMEDAPICPVSSETGEGVFDFYELLVERIGGLAKTRRRGVFRMPIERSFAQKGFGAVVTGIPVAGSIRVGEKIEVVPGGQTGRVRGIQRFLRDADEGGAGQCLALNVSDFGKRAPERGQVICLPGYLKPAEILHLRVTTVPGLDPPLRHAEQIKCHTGTSEAAGKIHLLEQKVLTEGETGLATVVLTHPVAAAVHDRFILRRPSPATTIAGGEILATTEGNKRPRKKDILATLKESEARFAGLDPTEDEYRNAAIADYLQTTRPMGAAPIDIARGLLLEVNDVQAGLEALVGAETVMAVQPDCVIHAKSYRACLNQALTRIKKARDGGALSMMAAELQRGRNWPAPLARRIRENLQTGGHITIRGDKLLLGGAIDGLSEKDRDLMERIAAEYEETGFHSPRPDELPSRLGAPLAATERLVTHLCDAGRLVRLNKNVILSYASFREAQQQVIEIIGRDGVLDSADFKGVIGSSRKYALAILDYLDARKVTVRVGNNRKLAPQYEKHLL